MRAFLITPGIVVVILVLRDAFDAILVPGRVKQRLRFVPLYFHWTWKAWAAAGRRVSNEERRESFLASTAHWR